MKKRAVIASGCGCSLVTVIVATSTHNPAYGLLACVATAIVCGLAIGIYSIRKA